MRQDLYGGLRNALERGAPKEQAIRSFINAGYSEPEVREAALALEQGVLPMVQPLTQQAKQMPSIPAKPQVKPLQIQQPVHQFGQQKASPTNFDVKANGHKPDLIVIMLVVILLFSIVAFVSSLIFRKQIAEFLSAFI